MEIVYSENQLIDYVTRSADVTEGHPILIDQFLEDAYEFDVDALSDGKTIHIGAIMQHIEEAGIHSGDSACVLPPYRITTEALKEVIAITEKLSIRLKVKGLINLQFAYKDGEIFVLEVNPRASRTIPFVSKATNVPLARIAAQLAAGIKLTQFNLKPWDICAGSIIAQEAGAKVSDWNGVKYPDSGERIIATNGLVHKEALDLLSNHNLDLYL